MSMPMACNLVPKFFPRYEVVGPVVYEIRFNSHSFVLFSCCFFFISVTSTVDV
jgi:hypothetical protein